MVSTRLQGCLSCLLPADPEDEWTKLWVEDAKSGKQVELSYQLIEKCGRGTFGTVFKIRTKAGEILAMKQIDLSNRYKCREVMMMKALNHMNVIPLHYWCFQKKFSKFRNTLFIEHMPESLHDYITRFKSAKNTLDPLVICCYTYQLCRGLAHLHHRGVAHRDVKPRNLLVNSATNLLKICDLGSAKRLDDKDRNITYICSRWYRAPELLFANKNYTVAIDVWSIGCCMAQMIRLEPLFKGRNSADQILKIFKVLGSPEKEEIEQLNILPDMLPDESVPRSSLAEVLVHDHSDDAERFLLKLLQYDPRKRPTAWNALRDGYFDELRQTSSGTPKKVTLPELFNFTQEELDYPPVQTGDSSQEDSSPDSDSGRGSSPSP